MDKKVLILGARGMLGQELVRVFSGPDKYSVLSWDREDVDVTRSAELKERVGESKPDIILNAIAYNAVDACEDPLEYASAHELNAEFPRVLSELAKELDATLVHYSTDYVFDGKKKDGHNEDEIPNPINAYGRTKHDGERSVLDSGARAYVIRLSKLFGKPGAGERAKRSFFDVMRELGGTKDMVRVVDEEQSAFTYAPDLADATYSLLADSAKPGVYHLINSESATWYEGCKELYALLKIATPIEKISSLDLERPAKRPAYSVLNNTKRPVLRSWKDALREFVRGKRI